MRVKSLIRVVSYSVILKMDVDIKDLYGNSGKRFKKMNTRWNFQHLTLITFLDFACCVVIFSGSTAI